MCGADLSDLDDDLDKEEMDEEEIDKEEIDEGDFDEKERCQDDGDSMMVKRMSSDKKRSPGGSGGRTENGS